MSLLSSRPKRSAVTHPVFWSILSVLCAPLGTAEATDPPTPSASPSFQEGKDYARLSTPVAPMTSNPREVVELFWYGCPHCYDMEPHTQAWLKHKPADVAFIRVPVVLNPNWEAGARAYYAAEGLGVLEKVHPILFDAIHRHKRSLRTEDELAAFFVEQGVDQEAFHKAYRSFQTETQLQRAKQLAQRYRTMSVPVLYVNGQYEVKSQRHFEVVDWLLAQPVTP